MKKVMKKFNRALSIMLVAAMVLTMAPQTAMPVLAEEVTVDETVTPDVPAENDEAVVEEVSDAPAIEDEGNAEGDNRTPVIDDETTSEEEAAETPEEEAVEIPEETPEVTPEEDSEEVPAKTTAGNEINAVNPSAAVITELEPDEGAKTKDLTNAVISYLYGCVDGDKKLATGKNLSFRVAPKKGYKLAASNAVTARITGTTTALTVTTSGTGEDAIYTIAWDAIKKTEGEATVGQPVDIIVATAAQKYAVQFTGTADSFKVTPVVLKSGSESTKVLGTELAGDTDEAELAIDAPKEYVIAAEEGYKLVSVKINGAAITPGDVTVEKTAASGNDPAVTETVKAYSVKPETYVKAGDDKVTVTVETREAATLTAKIAENSNVTLSNANTGENVIANTGNNFALITEGDLNENSKLSFKVKANDNYKITGVTAVAEADGVETAIPAEDIVRGTADETTKVVPYTVSLKSVKDFTVSTKIVITIATDYDDNENVHKVTFAGDLKNVDITTGTGNETLPDDLIKTVFTDATDKGLQINVAAKVGYVLPKRGGAADAADRDDLVISVEKKVAYKATGAASYGSPVDESEKIKVDEGVAILALSGTTEEDTARDFTVVSATVTINTEFAKNDEEKQLIVTNQLEDDEYKVQYAEAGGGFKDAVLDETVIESSDADPDNTWYIPEEAERVKVSVDTEKVTEAILDDVPLTKEAGDGNNYIFPASILKTADNDGSTLEISEVPDRKEEESATVTVKVNTDDVALTAYEVGDDDQNTNLTETEEEGYYTLDNAIVGKSLSLTFTQKDGATLKGVSYTMGETTGEVKATSRLGAVTAKLEIKEVTGDVTVVVDSESAYVVKLYERNGATELELKKDKDGVYEADYTASGIQIRLYKTEDADNSVPFYDVVVEDGNATAETGATVDQTTGGFATLGAIHKSERGKVLTIKVYKKDEEKPFEAKLRTNATSSAVKVTVGGKEVAKDSTVPMLLDARKTFKVESVGASTSDLGVKLFKKDGTALTAAEKAWFSGSSDVVTLSDDGTFTIITAAGKDERGEVEVRIYNKNEDVAAGQTEAALEGGSFKLNVEGYVVNNDVKDVTATPGVASNKIVRINLNANFKDKKNLPAHPETGDLYYKVVLDEIGGEVPTGVTKLTGAALTKYYPLDDYANPAQTVAIDLITADTRAVKDDIDVELTTTIKEVSLVQSVVAEPAADTDYVSGPAANIKDKDKALVTKAPLYETKLTVKAVNGAAVFTGQGDVKVATPVFGKDTGYDSLSVQFVDTKTGVLQGSLGTGSTNKAVYGQFRAWVDPTDNSIYVSSTNGSTKASNYKTLGVKVTAAYPTTDIGRGYAATAVVKLNIKQGIYRIDADESKAKLPETLYVVSGNKGKGASVKITPKYNYANKDYKPAKAALKWEIVSADQNANIQKNLNAVNSKGKAAPTISVKNGTVTVTKDYQFGKTVAENRFTVTAKADDFATNGVTKTFTFMITDEQDRLEAGSIVIVNGSGEVKNASALKAEDFDETLYVAALKNDVKKNQANYDQANDFMPVTITSGSKANLEVGTPDANNKAALTFKKPGTKLKINVNTVDGGKGSKDVKVKDSLIVNIAPYEKLGLYLYGADRSSYQPDNTETIKYAGGSNQMYELYLAHHMEGDWLGNSRYKNVKVTVKGGKLVSNKDWAKDTGDSMVGTAVVVNSKDGKATITVTDTASKKTTNYTIENTSFNAASQKAPSIKLYSPKKISQAGWYDIVYQVTDKTIDYTGHYVKVTPDYTAANNMADDLANEYGDIALAKIDENGRFAICDALLDNDGAYKMVATVGEMKRGEFLPLAKDVKLNFSIPKPKAENRNLTVKNSYTLDAKSASKVRIDVKSEPDYEISEAMNVIKKVQGKNDHTNRFTEFFEVQPLMFELGGYTCVGDYTIGLKPGLSAAQIEYITSKEGKDDCTGYITVSNGYGSMGSLTSRYNTKDVQVKISFKENKYSLTGASIFTNGKANTPVTATVSLMNGKNHEYAAMVAIDKTDDGGFIGTGNDAIDFDENGDIILKSKAAAIEPKKYDVKLIVVPMSSSYVTYDDAAGKWTWANKVGAGGTGTLTDAEMYAKAGIPVTAKIDVKALDAKKVIKIKNLNVTLNADNYVPAASGNVMGDYVAYVPYEFVAGNTDIATAAGSVKLVKDSKSNKDLNEIAGKTLITVDAKDANNSIIVDGKPCIRIKVSKAVLQEQYEKTEANKKAAAKDKAAVVTTYGAKLKVPVEIAYTNNGTTTEVVNFNVTMPKKALTFDELKDILSGTAEIGTGKTKRNVKTEIEKIKTPQAYSSNVILNGLLSKVWDKVSSEIPKDADVVLRTTTDWSSLGWECDTVTKADLNDGTKAADDTDTENPAVYDDIMTAGTAKVNMTLTNKLATGDGASVKLSYNFNAAALGVKHTWKSDGSAVEDAIAEVIQEYLDELKVTNDLTEDKLLADIWALYGVKEYNSDRDSVNIWIEWNMQPATERRTGSLNVKVWVNDHAAEAEKTIERIKNFGDVTSVLTTALNNTNVLAIVDDCSGIEEKIKAKIVADAKKAIGNDNLEVKYAQKVKTPATGTAAAVMEDDFTYNAAKASEAGSIAFKLKIESKASGRTVEYSVNAVTIPEAKASKYFATAADALAAVMKVVVTSNPDGEDALYDNLKATLNAVENTQESVESAVKAALADDALASDIIGWTAKNVTVIYAPAAPDGGTDNAPTPGKVTIKADIVLTGDPSVKGTFEVNEAPVVEWKATFQTAAHLKTAIDAAKAIEVDTEADFTALTDTTAKTKLQTVVNPLVTGANLAVEYVYDDETTPAAFSKNDTTKTAKYENVKINIKKGAEVADTCTVTFTFSVKATPPTPQE